jgi:tRNA dimethylallyltransferase
MPRLLVIAGPTATGKTEAGFQVARRWDVELVSADAMQVYRGMDIGTAKPSAEELAEFPHHGIDIREPTQPYDAAEFAADTDALIVTGRNIVVVGGTGFYLRALLVGLAPTPKADPALRAELELLVDPHAELARVDPVLAQRLHPNDRVRVIRGLEVFRVSGRPLSQIHAENPFTEPRHPAERLHLERDDLPERIDRRVLQMMDAGYLEEVRGLLDAGVPRDAKPMKSLGYRHLADHLLDGIELAEAVRLTQRDTRRFARKQRTMLRSIGGFQILPGRDHEAVLRAAERAFGG